MDDVSVGILSVDKLRGKREEDKGNLGFITGVF